MNGNSEHFGYGRKKTGLFVKLNFKFATNDLNHTFLLIFNNYSNNFRQNRIFKELNVLS